MLRYFYLDTPLPVDLPKSPAYLHCDTEVLSYDSKYYIFCTSAVSNQISIIINKHRKYNDGRQNTNILSPKRMIASSSFSLVA